MCEWYSPSQRLEKAAGVKGACTILGKSQATLYREHNPAAPVHGPRKPFHHPAELSDEERASRFHAGRGRSDRFHEKSAFELGESELLKSRQTHTERHFQVKITGWKAKIVVSADGAGIVCQARGLAR
jgi:hypothetical protein